MTRRSFHDNLENPSHLNQVRNEVYNIYHNKLGCIVQKFHYGSLPSQGSLRAKPHVLFIGNHSSGKSSFINHLLGTDMQCASLAPMDDMITIIAQDDQSEGDEDRNRSKGKPVWREKTGDVILINSDLPYASLRNIEGRNFAGRIRMKCYDHPLLENITLVDTPGMIDSTRNDRDYDFKSAIRWFVERSDFVLFFFDPDKPGTTGETLQIFTEVLTGIDHKLMILMNKVDQFEHISDFVRCYGTLTWNLAKVMTPSKDMPHVFTTYLPREAKKSRSGQASWSLSEFDGFRDQVEAKIRDAPARHADNMITELQEFTESLLVFTEICSMARSKLWWYNTGVLLTGLTLILVAMLGVAIFRHDEPPYTPSVFSGVCGLLMLFQISCILSERHCRQLVSELDTIHSHHLEKLSDDDKSRHSKLWLKIRPQLQAQIRSQGLSRMPQLRSSERKTLDSILQDEVQKLLQLVEDTSDSTMGGIQSLTA